MKIPGSWKDGYVLDYHTKSSDFIGYDEYGHPLFNTIRTPVGDLLYHLKYKGQKAALADLVSVAAEFIRGWGPPVKAIVPVPPSRSRSAQPVMRIAQGLGTLLGIPVHDVVRKAPTAKELKDVFDYHERLKLLANAHSVTSAELRGKAVLLVDDLYRSGATLNAVTASLTSQGKVREVYAFCPTRTRSSS
jgi:predicted amidophosphoribosyltransferase